MDERFLRVTNWDKYQDANLAAKYRESGGTLPWVKQMTGRLEDYEYTRLAPLSRYVFGEMLGLAARYGPNKIPYDNDWMQDKLHLRYLSDQLEGCISELVEGGFLQVFSQSDTEPGTDVGTEPGTSRVRVRVKKELKPPLTPPLAAVAAKERKRDEIWDELVELLGSSPSTRSERGRWNVAVKELREAGATPHEIRVRGAVYRKRWPDVSLTPTALTANWGSLNGVAELPHGERVRRHMVSLREKGLIP